MRKRVLSVVSALFLILCLSTSSIIGVQAHSSDKERVGRSRLTHNESSQGVQNIGISARGKYLMDGESSITKSGVGRIYVYADTTTYMTVDYLSTVIYVDVYNEKDDAWDQIDFWQVEQSNDYFVSTSKMMKVPRGYYYRVHADHVAGNRNDYPYDEVTSFTDGIFIP